MSDARIVHARGLNLSLGGRKILANVDIDLFPGEVVALVGPNGAGKSTLLSALCGDTDVDSGSIQINGLDLKQWKVGALARTRSVQMQDARVSFAFTASDVVRMGRAPWAGSVHEDRDETVIAEALELTETATMAGRSFPTLSGGEKARVSFARALAQETQLIMLDEPTAAMDIRYQELVLTETMARARAGASAVVVLHDLSLAAAYADRIVLLSAGSIRAVGTPVEVLRPDILEEVYRYPVAVIEHPESGGLAVMPIRQHLRYRNIPQEELV